MLRMMPYDIKVKSITTKTTTAAAAETHQTFRTLQAVSKKFQCTHIVSTHTGKQFSTHGQHMQVSNSVYTNGKHMQIHTSLYTQGVQVIQSRHMVNTYS